MEITPEERDALHRIYLSLPILRAKVTFEQAIGDATIRLCLRNTLRAKLEAQAQRKRRTEIDAASFELTPS